MRHKYIYKIENVVNKKRYIGQTQRRYLSSRLCAHKNKLRKGCHFNKHLQNSFNKYGEHSFVFALVEEVPPEQDITEREQYWIDYYKAEYNKRLAADTNLGLKLSKEHKRKIGKVVKKSWKRRKVVNKVLKPYIEEAHKIKNKVLSFDQILKLHKSYIFKMCNRFYKSNQQHKVELEDLKQEALLKLWDLYSTGKHITGDRNYIIYSIRNHLIDYVRRQKKDLAAKSISIEDSEFYKI